VIPDAETVLLADDKLIVLGPVDALERLADGRGPITEAEAMASID
jgi:hypothetical protein